MATEEDKTSSFPFGGLLGVAWQVLLAMVVALPICMYLWPRLPLMSMPSMWGLSLERLVLFLLVWGLLVFLLRRFPLISHGVLIVAVGVVTVQGMRGGHGFRDPACRRGDPLCSPPSGRKGHRSGLRIC